MYDLWVLGPNGFHRHFTGDASAREQGAAPEIAVAYDNVRGNVRAVLRNAGHKPVAFSVTANAYSEPGPWLVKVGPNAEETCYWPLHRSGHWYDFTAAVVELPGFTRRFAGRVETGRASISDPALGGRAVGEQLLIE